MVLHYRFFPDSHLPLLMILTIPDVLTEYQQEPVEFYRSQWACLSLQCVFSPLKAVFPITVNVHRCHAEHNPEQVQTVTATELSVVLCVSIRIQ